MADPEISAIHPLQYPVEYFDAQVQFAQKWSEVSGEDLQHTLLAKTALYRRVIGQALSDDGPAEAWGTLMAKITPENDAAAITDHLYAAFAAAPHSVYQAPQKTNPFGYDYLQDKQTAKIHFTNPIRGEKPLSDANMAQRREDFRELLERIRVEQPEAALLMSATWLRSTAHYRSLTPTGSAEQQSLMSPTMKFGGNSLWGQFVDASGFVNQRVYDQFIAAVGTAKTEADLLAAFPYQTMQAVDDIDLYYDAYGVVSPASDQK